MREFLSFRPFIGAHVKLLLLHGRITISADDKSPPGECRDCKLMAMIRAVGIPAATPDELPCRVSGMTRNSDNAKSTLSSPLEQHRHAIHDGRHTLSFSSLARFIRAIYTFCRCSRACRFAALGLDIVDRRLNTRRSMSFRLEIGAQMPRRRPASHGLDARARRHGITFMSYELIL